MPATPTAAHEAPPTQQPLPGLADHAPEARDSHTRSRRQPARPAHPPTDDEILGLDTASPRSPDPVQAAFDFDATSADAWLDGAHSPSPDGSVIPSEARNLSSGADHTTDGAAPASNRADEASAAEPARFRNIFEANPELRQAWQDAQAYRETFATPEAARAATASSPTSIASTRSFSRATRKITSSWRASSPPSIPTLSHPSRKPSPPSPQRRRQAM